MIISSITLALISGLVSIILPDILPTMIVNGQFSFLAKFINITGGIGFLIGTYFFVYSDKHQTDQSQPTKKSHTESIVFANHCLLFGIAGLLFETSELWDAGWWWWHILRFIAYLVVLVYFFTLFNRSQNQLRLNEIELENINNDLELRVQQRTAELEKANQVKSDFLSSMSHELRTPMNAILGFGQLLKLDSQGFNDTQKENIKEILGAGNHLMSLINALLDLTKIESEKLDIFMDEVSVDIVLQQCISMIKVQAEEQQIELIDHVSQKGHKIQADPSRLKQVLLNLLTNAIKYNQKHGRITMYSETTDTQRLRIYVKDTGQGLTTEEIARLFTPFERLNTTTNIEGTGIGLVISRGLTEAMRGTIGVESTPGEGTIFWVEFDMV